MGPHFCRPFPDRTLNALLPSTHTPEQHGRVRQVAAAWVLQIGRAVVKENHRQFTFHPSGPSLAPSASQATRVPATVPMAPMTKATSVDPALPANLCGEASSLS